MAAAFVTVPALVRAQPQVVRGKAPSAARLSVRAKASYKVTLQTPEGEKVITCADDVYILDAAEVSAAKVDPGRATAEALRPRARRCRVGGGHRPAVLVPRRRLLLLRGQGGGARSFSTAPAPVRTRLAAGAAVARRSGAVALPPGDPRESPRTVTHDNRRMSRRARLIRATSPSWTTTRWVRASS